MEKKIDDLLIIPTGPTTFKAQMGAWMRYNSYRKLKEMISNSMNVTVSLSQLLKKVPSNNFNIY